MITIATKVGLIGGVQEQLAPGLNPRSAQRSCCRVCRGSARLKVVEMIVIMIMIMITPTHPIPPSGAQVYFCFAAKNLLHSRCNSGSMRSQSADKCKSLRTKLLKKHKWKKVYRTSLYFTFIRSEFVRNEPINRSLIKTCVRSQICHVGDFFAEFINRPPLDLTSTDDTYFPLYHHHQSSADF